MRTYRVVGLPNLFALSLLVAMSNPVAAAPLVTSDSGDISDGIATFRAALGDPLNGGTVGEQQAGRREINWDGVPPGVSNVDTFAAGFFNTNSPRGAVFSPGNGFRVSDVDFADVNANYADEFNAFSPAKTFMVVGSNTMEVQFQVAGATTPASVRGFGVVFSDVDVPGSARLEFFRGVESLGVWSAPARSDTTGLSFIGVVFQGGEAVTRVRITSGQAALAANRDDISDGGALDLVVMDDFLYGEPHPDIDRDGVFDTVDQLLTSDTRAKVDTNINDPAQTTLDNRTLSTGETIQDLVLKCRAQSPTVILFRRCIRELANRLRRTRVITPAQSTELIGAATRSRTY